MTNNKTAIVIRLEAAEGKEKQAQQFLENSKDIVSEEPGTLSWNVAKLPQRAFSVLGVFVNDKARQQHLDGEFPKQLKKSLELFTVHPVIEKADVIVEKVGEPEHAH